MRLFLTLSLGLFCFSSQAAEVKTVGVTASSTLPDTGKVNYSPKNLTDSLQSKVWTEGDKDGSGIGTTITIDLGSEQAVSGLKIWNGHWFSQTEWKRNNRVKDLEISFSDGSKESFRLKDKQVAEAIAFSGTKKTDTIRLRIRSVYRSTTWDDTAISEIKVLGPGSDSFVSVASWADSSHLPADADGSYEVSNLWDGILDSLWCEGVDGDGAGEWVEFNFGSTKSISKMTLVNGNAYSLSWWMKYNRVLTAVLEFSNGNQQEVAIKNSIRPQTIAFNPVRASKVRMRITSVKQGSKAKESSDYDTVCLSEAKFE